MAVFLKYLSPKFFFGLLLTAVLSFITGLFTEWWVIAVVGFVVHFILEMRPRYAFFSGFCAAFLLWTSLTLYVSFLDHFQTAKMVAQLFFSQPIAWVTNVISGMVSGIVVALASLSGAHARRVLRMRSIAKVIRADISRYPEPDALPDADTSDDHTADLPPDPDRVRVSVDQFRTNVYRPKS